jgi:hypothetical protein
MLNRASVIFQRASDQKFLGTDISLKAFLDNPELYNIVDHESINEIVTGLFKNKYTVIHDATNAVVSVG